MFLLRSALATTAVAVSAAAACAATFTAPFPSTSSTFIASSGFFFLTTHSVEETFNGTGVFDAVELTLDLDISPSFSFETTDQTINFDVLVNSTNIGSFSFSGASGPGVQNYNFSLSDPTPLLDVYTVRLEVTNTIPSGSGSISFGEGTSFVTISDEAVSVIPLPASMPLVASGLMLLGALSARRRKMQTTA